jgi:hypothetical protein
VNRYLCIPILVALFNPSSRSISRGVPQKPNTVEAEEVRLGYDLVLTKCRGTSCHAESVAKGAVRLTLYYEDPDLYWGYDSFEQQAGELLYQSWFKASRVSKGGGFERTLGCGFVGRVGTMSGKELTSAQKVFTGREWAGFPPMSVSGRTYSEGEDRITPTLRVRVLRGAN